MRPRFNGSGTDFTVCAFWLVALVLSAWGLTLSVLAAAVRRSPGWATHVEEDDYLEPEPLEMAGHPHFRQR